jgi:competence protein ComEC
VTAVERVGAMGEFADSSPWRRRPPDLRLVPLAATAWLCALVVPVAPVPVVVGTAIGLAALVPVILLLGRRRAPDRRSALGRGVNVLAVVLLGGAAFSLITLVHVSSTRAGPVPTLAADTAVVSVDLRVRSDPVRREGRGFRSAYVVLDAEVVRVTARGVTTRVSTPVVVIAPMSWGSVQPDELVSTTGRLSPTERGDRAAAVLSARSPPHLVEAASPAHQAASRLRAGLRAAVADLTEAERGLVPALVVGDESNLPDHVVDDFEQAGLTHLTAVSGTNFTLVLAVVLTAARWARVPFGLLPVLGVLTTLGFVLLARPEPSVLRAAAMGLVGLLAVFAGTRRSGVPALAVAVISVLALDPWLGRTYGFALSVLATAGILALAPSCTDALRRWLPRTVAAAIAVPLAAQLACAPVVAMLSGSVSVVAVFANVVAAPAVFPATVLGLLATLTTPLDVRLAAVPARLSGYAARWIIEVAEVSASLPGGSVSWPASWLGIAVLSLLCLAAALTAPALLRRRALTLAVAGLTTCWVLQPIRSFVPLAWLTGWPPAGWVVVACDVGQGDALVLRAGPRTGVVVDTGPEPATVDRCLAELGVTDVPYVLLTHYHSDHTSGLPGVLRGRRVGEIGVRPFQPSAGRPGTSPNAAQRVLAWAGDAAVPVTVAVPGERRRVGQVTWTVVSSSEDTLAADAPSRRDAVPGDESAENDASVVVVAETQGLRVLLTGDIEPPTQRALLRSGVDLRADVLKVPHHGSRYQDHDFLAATQARIALVSVGAGNDYGHPSESVLRALRRGGAVVARTDRVGSVAIVRDGDRLAVVTRREDETLSAWRGMLALDGSEVTVTRGLGPRRSHPHRGPGGLSRRTRRRGRAPRGAGG